MMWWGPAEILHMKKIGHGGTLDPLAAGVLPVFTGMATRFLEYAAHEEKATGQS